ncbi:MAG: hypothetical protein CVV64_19035 [Candidatus Wallbacteria bacterium HGW-Wallbacteria-1]|jgi:butyrate kinase|uniref:Uncharacterized protein n=1 Tax=Candidatus Wallbacteria bacterium HGW-Wallbacteria-1 TaxID=2013854 RepID=A0A2N1PJC2_9BACT|nr:MAG: hypothetical protein CVV64_19035 [Candidatus Wallbacteria bacterium HGW-Wallbacteria-1]
MTKKQTQSESNPTILSVHSDQWDTRVSIFSGPNPVNRARADHSPTEIALLEDPAERTRFVTDTVYRLMDTMSFDPSGLDIVAASCGPVMPLACGVYTFSRAIVDDMNSGRYGFTGETYGALAAWDVATRYDVQLAVPFPRSCDDYRVKARIGLEPSVTRASKCDVLNAWFAAERASGGKARDQKVVVAMMDRESFVAAFDRGRLIDSTWNEGPMDSMSGKGLSGYLGVSDLLRAEEVARRDDGVPKAVVDAYGYQFAKAVYQMAAALGGRLDLIVSTGYNASAHSLEETFQPVVEHLAPLKVIPGRDGSAAAALTVADAIRRGSLKEAGF